MKRALLLLVALGLGTPSMGRAMKVLPPEKSEYVDASGGLKLTVPGPRGAGTTLTVVKPLRNTVHKWEKPPQNGVPSAVLMSKERGVVVLLGSLGDPGMSLGHVEIRSLEGKQLAFIQLSQSIPDLEELARNHREKMGNFPWIEEARLDEKDGVVRIHVCSKVPVRISLTDYKVTVEPH